MDQQFSQKFVLDWINAWNCHDLNKILNHYTDDFEIKSPIIKQIMDIDSGSLKGKKQIRAYWEKALSINPKLHFEIIRSYTGANSIVIQYKGHRGLSAETFFFNTADKVISAHAYYE